MFRLLATPWTTAHQASPSMGFSRQEYWSGVPSPSPIQVYCCLFLYFFSSYFLYLGAPMLDAYIFYNTYIFSFYIILFIYLFLAVLGLYCYTSFSLIVMSMGYTSLQCWGSQCSGFSCFRSWILGHAGFSHCGT